MHTPLNILANDYRLEESNIESEINIAANAGLQL